MDYIMVQIIFLLKCNQFWIINHNFLAFSHLKARQAEIAKLDEAISLAETESRDQTSRLAWKKTHGRQSETNRVLIVPNIGRCSYILTLFCIAIEFTSETLDEVHRGKTQVCGRNWRLWTLSRRSLSLFSLTVRLFCLSRSLRIG